MTIFEIQARIDEDDPRNPYRVVSSRELPPGEHTLTTTIASAIVEVTPDEHVIVDFGQSKGDFDIPILGTSREGTYEGEVGRVELKPKIAKTVIQLPRHLDNENALLVMRLKTRPKVGQIIA
ncbi:hypothetical protein A3A79_03535 [Candidatus Gottesmanbacteria bacterium RIFCSPLOWO2_01_FULL_43_11b]|uniref:Uncharacterized protein n=1 Tax=Candidatus Gottesmanbacteria bacterium RIFCSPLOWO2_01_FULL_43_11b TaxID=1798392 RepID=A0A1F6AII3_9BACT|nr:MAG: hypothetical protein A3A79_03535 [Candidatus Gottesmanbacteria bacterium RIFCSPLOWO2_01_FULL_43_11b]